MDSNIRIISLGGFGEIGKNITVIEYKDEIIVIDNGLSFPTNDMPGIDVVIADTTYLVENKNKVKALLLTHGHEDHIGGVPYLLKQINIPIYATKLTLALVANKLKEHKIENVTTVEIKDRSIVKLGKYFAAEFIHVTHSVAGSVAIALATPQGILFHTGDFKIDYTPLSGDIINLSRIAEIGKKGVLCLLAESTNVERAGYTMSESIVGDTFKKIFIEAGTRRLIVATFSSNIDRLQILLDLAKQMKRRVAISGRSMLNVIETASRIGILKYDATLFVDIDKISSIPDNQLLILSTGSQGEPLSALTRMASGTFNKLTVGVNDTIVVSASPIPGNEKDVYTVINNLFRLGAEVIYHTLDDVHVSGHACQEELKLIHALVKPKFFIPIHGEYRHLKQHAKLATTIGMNPNNIVIADIGDVIVINSKSINIKGQVTSGIVLVDGLGVGDVGKMVLKDRKQLSEDGMIIIVMSINTTQGKLTSAPEVISRGCFYVGDGEGNSNDIIDDIRSIACSELNGIDYKEFNSNNVKQSVYKTVKIYCTKRLKRNPMILPIIIET